MAKVSSSESSFGGEYMVQDSDHTVDTHQGSSKANRGGARQADQSQSTGRQQGGDHNGSRQQGGERR